MRASRERPSGKCRTVPKAWISTPCWCSQGWLLATTRLVVDSGWSVTAIVLSADVERHAAVCITNILSHAACPRIDNHQNVRAQARRRRATDQDKLYWARPPIRCRRGQEIYRQNGAAGHWYRLTSGTARRFALRLDGRRQIVDLLVPGDVFGFGVRGRHRFTVEE